jgi:hypothetical protein
VIRPRVFNVVAISLLLCLATVGLWVRSQWTRYIIAVAWIGDGTRAVDAIDLDSLGGHLTFQSNQVLYADQKEFDRVAQSFHQSHFYFSRLPAPARPLFRGRFGFGYVANAIWFPDWLPTAIFGVLPAWYCLSAWRRSRLARPGLCRNCRYDLTGNTSGVCPECGTAVEGKAGVNA